MATKIYPNAQNFVWGNTSLVSRECLSFPIMERKRNHSNHAGQLCAGGGVYKLDSVYSRKKATEKTAALSRDGGTGASIRKPLELAKLLEPYVNRVALIVQIELQPLE